MKISQQTLSLLKNFSLINQNLLIQPGTKLSTMAVAKNILAAAEVSEKFPITAGIYNLSEFLGTLGLFTAPDVDFREKYARISEGGAAVNYYYADASILIAPQKEIKMPDAEVVIQLTQQQIQTLQKASATLSAPDLSFTVEDDNIVAIVTDKKNNTANNFRVVLDTNETGNTFKFNFRVELIKLVPGDYEVSLSSRNISKWKTDTVEYFIALEQDSTFGQ